MCDHNWGFPRPELSRTRSYSVVLNLSWVDLTKALFGLWKKQTNAICIGGSVSTSHDVFFTLLEAIDNLIKIKFPESKTKERKVLT